MRSIYLDYNATTPVDQRVIDTMLPYYNRIYGNPSSTYHTYGMDAYYAVNQSLQMISNYFHTETIDDIIFTSGATESNNLILKSFIESYDSHCHIITTPIEHASVYQTLKHYEPDVTVDYLKIDDSGIVDVDDLKSKIRSDTSLVSIIGANNEIGTIQPLSQIVTIAHQHNVPVHSDLTQLIPYQYINLHEIGIDYISLSGHKIYAPKGIGLVVCNNDSSLSKLSPQILGGGQQNNYRSGTLNVPGIIGLSKAFEILSNELKKDVRHCESLYYHVIEQLENNQIVFKINGSKVFRIKNNLNLSFEDISSIKLIEKMPGFSFSTGSACSAPSGKLSYVLQAIGCSEDVIQNSIRVSFGRFTTENDIKEFTNSLINVIRGKQ